MAGAAGGHSLSLGVSRTLGVGFTLRTRADGARMPACPSPPLLPALTLPLTPAELAPLQSGGCR